MCACSIDSVSTSYNANTVTLLSNLSYRPFGIAKGMDNRSGGTVDNVFDQSGRLTIANPGADKEQTYTYDAVGNLTSVTSPNASWYNRVFGYDALNRLEHAEGPYGIINYTYDGVGNRLTKVANNQTTTYTYATGTNRIQETTGPVAYTYDANGNITGIGSKVLTYNQNNRLIRVEKNSNVLGEYTYNGLGQRVIKSANNVTTVFHYDFNGNIIAESDESGNFVYEYLYKGSTRLALVDVTSGEMFSYLNDRLGTTLMLTDSTNTVVWEGIYKPFGEADVNPNSSVVNNFRFAGQYYDEETGLHYNWHRYYDPRAGRYLRPDPIGLAGGINSFIYSSNNPINIADALGLGPNDYIYRTVYEHRSTGLSRLRMYRNPIRQSNALTRILLNGINYFTPLIDIQQYQTKTYIDIQVVEYEVFYKTHRISLHEEEIASNIIGGSEEWLCESEPILENTSWSISDISYYETTINNNNKIESVLKDINEGPVSFIVRDRTRKR